MGVVTGLALAGTAFQVLGALQAKQEQKNLARIHKAEINFQAETSQDLFNFITLPNLRLQQRVRRGRQASSLAKRGVAIGQGSALTQLSEQARIDSINVSLAKFQNELNQRSFDVEKILTKRSIKQASTEQAFTIASGAVSGASTAQGFF